MDKNFTFLNFYYFTNNQLGKCPPPSLLAKCHWRDRQWSGSRVMLKTVFYCCFPIITLFLLRDSLPLMVVPSSNCIFTSFAFIHLLIQHIPWGMWRLGSRLIFTENPTLYHTNDSILLLLHHSNYPPTQPHSGDFVITVSYLSSSSLNFITNLLSAQLLPRSGFNLMHTQLNLPSPCVYKSPCEPAFSLHSST